MKKLICVLLSLILLLSLAACQTTNPPPTDPAPTDPTPTSAKPTEPKPTEPKPTEPAPTEPAPAELAANGFCAVGILNADAGTAKILADNGAIAEIPYTSELEIRPGMVYAFAKNGDTYTLSSAGFINADYSAWAVRTFDNTHMGAPDQLFTHDGVNETLYDLTDDCVIFCCFSDTSYRIFRGSDAIKYSDWPCDCYFDANENPNGGNRLVSVMLVLDVDTDTWQDGYANEATTYFFDSEGFGWTDGDLIIE